MEDDYDVAVLGTGFEECILSGLLSVDGKKVLHMDRNNYYGGEAASLTLEQLFEKFGAGFPPESLGASRSYNVDMCPKLIMANGVLVKVLIRTDVTRYLEFRSIGGSFVYKDNKVHKVPATDSEALKSGLMGLFQKRHAKNFFLYVQDVNCDDPSTWKGYDLNKVTMKELCSKHSLDDNTMSFVGHALALHREDKYLTEPALETVRRIQLYSSSLARYNKSPYIYPLYGLGELPQAFARLSAIYGGTFMLNKPFDGFDFDANGRVCGVKSEGETAKCSTVFCSPDYLPEDQVERRGYIVRSFCILDHPIPNTDNIDSLQLIIPQRAANRSHDIYVSCCSFGHNVAPESKYIAIASTTLEGNADAALKDSKLAEAELQIAYKMMGKALVRFTEVKPRLFPKIDSAKTGIFCSSTLDETSHFQSSVEEVMYLYKAYAGKEVDLTPPVKEEQQQ